MPGKLMVEELVIDDSFNNYCLRTNEADILFWQQYLAAHPYEKEKIEEARQIVLALHAMLQQGQIYCGVPTEETKPVTPAPIKIIVRKIVRYSAAVAAVLLLVLALKSYWNTNIATPLLTGQNKENTAAKAFVFTTAKGQKKHITLPDSSKVYLNAGSSLQTDKGFGRDNRTVYLIGEALFDVTHNAKRPFIVQVAGYDIKVLGTLFNVKAYPGEKSSETALLRGKVQIIKKDGGDLTLVPNQKVIFKNINKAGVMTDSAKNTPALFASQKIVPVHFSNIDGTVVETAWAQNRLEMVNEKFVDIKEKLERWYNVKIVFKDAAVQQYMFTATFENENIEQVLQALQYAYPFTYKIQGDEITISK